MMDGFIWLSIVGACVSLAATRALIAWQRKEGLGQPIRDYGPDIHQHKRGTPTMGGLAILIALGLVWLWLAISGGVTPPVLLVFVAGVGFGLIGLLDDALKFWQKSSEGLAARYKLLLQAVVSLLLCWLANAQGLFNVAIKVPFMHGAWALPWSMSLSLAVLALMCTVNAVNLNDGLDGLATGTTLISLGALAIVANSQGHSDLTGFLIVSIGVLLGFFWWNVHPARIFLGDTGSFALGGLVGAAAVATRTELLLPFFAFVPLLEALSVLLQVTSFKLFKRRIFKIAPLHHHFERAKGVNYEFLLPNQEWPEPLITARFWIIAAVLAIIGLGAYR